MLRFPRVAAAAAAPLFLVALLAGGGAQACGPDSDCEIGDRNYRIYLPEGFGADGPGGAIVYSHGYKGSSKGTMRNQSLRRVADELGVALIAGNDAGDDWSLPGAPSPNYKPEIDEIAYYRAVIADATTRFPIDPDRLLATGFSAGGMMTWNLACDAGDLFAGFAPIAGTFWAPVPDQMRWSRSPNVLHTSMV